MIFPKTFEFSALVPFGVDQPTICLEQNSLSGCKLANSKYITSSFVNLTIGTWKSQAAKSLNFPKVWRLIVFLRKVHPAYYSWLVFHQEHCWLLLKWVNSPWGVENSLQSQGTIIVQGRWYQNEMQSVNNEDWVEAFHFHVAGKFTTKPH